MIDRWARAAGQEIAGPFTQRALLVETVNGTASSAIPSVASRRAARPLGRFFRRVLTGGDIGLGESYMDGDWTHARSGGARAADAAQPSRARRPAGGLAGRAHRLRGAIARRLRDNSLAGSRRHIHRHYDLGNEFFRALSRRQPADVFRAPTSSRPRRLARGGAGQQAAIAICQKLDLAARRSRARDRQRLGRLRASGRRRATAAA